MLNSEETLLCGWLAAYPKKEGNAAVTLPCKRAKEIVQAGVLKM